MPRFSVRIGYYLFLRFTNCYTSFTTGFCHHFKIVMFLPSILKLKLDETFKALSACSMLSFIKMPVK
jgi:hypothetical protein